MQLETTRPLNFLANGTSPGGLNALSELLSKIDPKVQAAYVITQHLSPKYISQLASILNARSSIPVSEGQDSETILAGKAYVAPADKHMVIKEGRIILEESPKLNFARPSIDKLFESVAESYGEHSVGIILTGAGSDGSSGIRKIKERGGYTIAQDPAFAAYPSMPHSAIETGKVDFILPIRDIPEYVGKIVDDPDSLLNEITVSGLEEILMYLEDSQHTRFSHYKKTTLKRRVKTRLSVLGITQPSEYIKYMSANTEEIYNLINTILVNVTSFFRDPDSFEVLKVELIDLISRKGQGDEIRIWTPGCSSGEEAYSIAMVLSDALGNRIHKFDVKIFATDIDEEAIEFARRGEYDSERIKNIPERYRQKYFEKEGDTYKVNKLIRASIVFGINDLTVAAPIAKVDLISCRNVLIYFEKELQKRIMGMFHYSLNPNGILFMGKSESNILVPDLFSAVDKSHRLFRKIESTVSVLFPKNRIFNIAENTEIEKAVVKSSFAYSELYKLYEKVLTNLSDFILSVDREMNVLSFNAIAGSLFSLDQKKALGKPLSETIPELGDALIEADVQTSMDTQDVIVRDEFCFSREFPIEMCFQLRYIPFGTDKEETRQVIIIGKDISEVNKLKRDNLKYKKENLEQLNQLTILNEELQTSNEELETVNEELQASNEELETTNEELQSTNEELETTNEELRATNEELAAAYSELKSSLSEKEIQRQMLEERTRELESTESKLHEKTVALEDLNKNLEHKIKEGVEMIHTQEQMLIQQSKLAAMGEMIGAIAHQWRQPLNSLGILVQSMEDDVKHDAPLQQKVEVKIEECMDQIEYMSRTINDFRNFFTPVNQREEFNVLEAVRETVGIISAQIISRDITLCIRSIELDGAESVIDGSSPDSLRGSSEPSPESFLLSNYRSQFKQALLNIINNARDAIVERIDADEPDFSGRVDILAERKDASIHVHVCDNGGGIPGDVHERIFEPYFTTKEVGKGTGIGLYITKVIVENHMGGKIHVRSGGEGAAFVIEMPLEVSEENDPEATV